MPEILHKPLACIENVALLELPPKVMSAGETILSLLASRDELSSSSPAHELSDNDAITMPKAKTPYILFLIFITIVFLKYLYLYIIT